MSWGNKILGAYIVFIGGMLSMVYIASKQTNEMEDEQYYVKELQYQNIITAKNNLAATQKQVEISDTLNSVCIHLPKAVSNQLHQGNLRIIRQSDQSKDFTVNLNVDTASRQYVPKSRFIKGQYKFQLSWQNDSVPYYNEQLVYIK